MDKVLPDKVLFYITDAASYMLKSEQALKMFYPKLCIIYMTHDLHRVSEAIRDKFLKVDKLI